MEHDNSPIQQAFSLMTEVLEKEIEKEVLHPHLGQLLAMSFNSAHKLLTTNNLIRTDG